jgi:hypothetical protein
MTTPDEKKEIDDGTTYATARHVFKSDYLGNRGRDCCLEMFGEEDDECREYNKNYPNPDTL